MKNSERPASMGPSRRPSQDSPSAPSEPQPAAQAPSEPPRRAKGKGSSRGYNPYDTVNTRFPDLWHAKPKRA
jgi:hypothetical protein